MQFFSSQTTFYPLDQDPGSTSLVLIFPIFIRLPNSCLTEQKTTVNATAAVPNVQR